mmetsp:Transcript_14872/g.20126  ORF Transcript_14872/g.20126 Transcript_14872/m.20126 type:complete len:125 (-) Transcript_14872:62-436(-)
MEKFCAPSLEIPLRVASHLQASEEAAREAKSPSQGQAQADDQLTDSSNLVLKPQEQAAETQAQAEVAVPAVALKLVEVQLMIKGKANEDAQAIAQNVYAQFKNRDWPSGGSDLELQQFILSYDF